MSKRQDERNARLELAQELIFETGWNITDPVGGRIVRALKVKLGLDRRQARQLERRACEHLRVSAVLLWVEWAKHEAELPPENTPRNGWLVKQVVMLSKLALVQEAVERNIAAYDRMKEKGGSV